MAWAAVGVVLCAIVVACSVPQTEPVPRDTLGRAQAVLDESDAGRTVGVPVGGSVTVHLEADHGAGLDWTVTSSPDPSVVQFDPPEFRPAGQGTNGPGVEVWTFRAVGPGSVTIEMAYAPTSNPEAVRKQFGFILSAT